MTSRWRHLTAEVLYLVQRDTARTMAELAEMTGATVTEIKPVCWSLCHRHRLDYAAGYFTATPHREVA